MNNRHEILSNVFYPTDAFNVQRHWKFPYDGGWKMYLFFDKLLYNFVLLFRIIIVINNKHPVHVRAVCERRVIRRLAINMSSVSPSLDGNYNRII